MKGGHPMSLTTHPYRFFSDKMAFLDLWGPTLKQLTGNIVKSVWGIWDCMKQTWFTGGPMLVCLSSGILSVNVSCEQYLAVGWNDLLPSDPAVWFDEEQRSSPALIGLEWEEELEWREYSGASSALGHAVRVIIPIDGPHTLNGLRLLLDNGSGLELRDTGDEIAAFYIPPEAHKASLHPADR